MAKNRKPKPNPWDVAGVPAAGNPWGTAYDVAPWLTPQGRNPGLSGDNSRERGSVATGKPLARPKAKPPKVRARPVVPSVPSVAAGSDVKPKATVPPPARQPAAATAAPAYQGKTDAQLAAEAKKYVDAALAPLFAQIENERKLTEQQYANRAAGLQAGYSALGQVQAGLAPQIQETYKQAGDSTAAYGAGFSQELKAASDGTASNINEFLAKQGSPQQVQGAGSTGATDVLYGLGGALPASDLAKQGAAFSSAAAFLPSTAKALGLDATKQANMAAADALAAISGKRIEAESGRGKMLADVLNQLRTAETQKQAVAINAAIAGVEGEQKAAQQQFNNTLAYARTFGVTPDGQLTLAARKFQQQAAKNDKKKLSPSKYATLKEKAGKAADLFYYGDPKKGVQALDYQTALARVMRQYSLKLPDAQAVLDTYWKPGEDGRPWLNHQQRQALVAAGANPQQVEQAMWNEQLATQLLTRLGG